VPGGRAGRVAPVVLTTIEAAPKVSAGVGDGGLKPAVVDAVPRIAAGPAEGSSHPVVAWGFGTSAKTAVAVSDASAMAPVPAVDSRVNTKRSMVGVGLLTLWVLGVWVAGVRVICAWIRTRELCRGASRVVDAGLVRLLGRLAGEVGVRKVPELLVADDVTGPLLTGVIRPAIVLPAALAAAGTYFVRKKVVSGEGLSYLRPGMSVDVWLRGQR
jgi:hypothetical protein